MSVADYLGTETIVRASANPLELSLFEDPTGGLTSGPAEELSTTEMEALVRLHVSAYSPSVFYLLYTPFVDVVRLIVEGGLLPEGTELRGVDGNSGKSGRDGAVGDSKEDEEGSASTVTPSLRRPEEVMARWFSDGSAVLRDPHGATAGAMGERRWKLLGEALVSFYAPIEEVMPLTRVVRKRGLPEHLYIPFFRQLAMSLVPPESRRSVAATLPGVILGLANGRAPRLLALPDDHVERVLTVAELFLGVAQETGNTDLAYLGVQLLRANDLMTPFAFQKQLTNVFSAAARLQTDWLVRSTGQLVDAFPRWVDYERMVRHDNVVHLCELRDAAKASGSPKPCLASKGESECGVGQQQHEYFTSRRLEDVERVSALERNVEQAVLRREAALLAEVQAMEQRRLRLQLKRVETDGPAYTREHHVPPSPVRRGVEVRETESKASSTPRGDDNNNKGGKRTKKRRPSHAKPRLKSRGGKELLPADEEPLDEYSL